MQIQWINEQGNEIVDLARSDALRMVRRGRAVLVKVEVAEEPPKEPEASDADSTD